MCTIAPRFPSKTRGIGSMRNREVTLVQNNIPKESILIYDSSQNQLDFSIFETTGILHINKKKLQDTIEIKITSELIATISYNTSNPRTNGCCDFGELQDVIIENKTFKIDKNVITIYL